MSTIPLSSVISDDRIRTQYRNIDSLAENISEVGLIQPLVLISRTDGTFSLNAGGRRLEALRSLGVTELYHATSCDPARPGYILKGEEGSVLSHLLTELNENLNREDIDWRDNMRGLVRAYRLANAEANEKGREIAMLTFATMIGGSYQDLHAAVAVHDAVVADPERFKDITSVRGAYAVILKQNAQFLENQLDRRMRQNKGKTVSVQIEKEPDATTTTVPDPDPVSVINLSSNFFLGDSISYLESLPPTFDHIICDPDYGVSAERLATKGWSPDSSSAGVAQSSIEDSLADLKRFLSASFTATRDNAFCVFFYDLDHHEKLMSMAKAVGWAVQRWPLIWHKTDFHGNAAPGSNFCKNMEYAMVLRKPGAQLQSVQTSSIFSLPSERASKQFNHPFAKPEALWTKIFSAVAIKGQRVFDPFMGSGSSCVAAIRYGLHAQGMELNPDHYNNALINIRTCYHELLGHTEFE